MGRTGWGVPLDYSPAPARAAPSSRVWEFLFERVTSRYRAGVPDPEYDTGLSIDLDHLYRRYGPMVWRRCRWLLRDDQQAQEAMQEVFVQLLRRQEGLVIDTPSAMLHRVATNICLNRLRSAKRHPEDPDDALLLRVAAAPEVDSRLPAARLLDRLFDREPPSTRTIATLHLLDGMSLEEVAAEVGLSVSGVRKRLRTLRVHLHELEPALEAK